MSSPSETLRLTTWASQRQKVMSTFSHPPGLVQIPPRCNEGMRLGASPRHEELEILQFPFNGHLFGLSNSPHNVQVIQFLLHIWLSEDDFGPFFKFLVVIGLAEKIHHRGAFPPSPLLCVGRSGEEPRTLCYYCYMEIEFGNPLTQQRNLNSYLQNRCPPLQILLPLNSRNNRP